MKVVLVQDVPNVADAGEVKEVKRGHARNYLLPKGFAVPATAEELKRVEALKRADYTGWIAAEPFVYEPDGPACAARAAGYLRGLLEATS